MIAITSYISRSGNTNKLQNVTILAGLAIAFPPITNIYHAETVSIESVNKLWFNTRVQKTSDFCPIWSILGCKFLPFSPVIPVVLVSCLIQKTIISFYLLIGYWFSHNIWTTNRTRGTTIVEVRHKAVTSSKGWSKHNKIRLYCGSPPSLHVFMCDELATEIKLSCKCI